MILNVSIQTSFSTHCTFTLLTILSFEVTLHKFKELLLRNLKKDVDVVASSAGG